ncbi:hypothetical protein [Paraburkholderia jirisanensis]
MNPRIEPLLMTEAFIICIAPVIPAVVVPVNVPTSVTGGKPAAVFDQPMLALPVNVKPCVLIVRALVGAGSKALEA